MTSRSELLHGLSSALSDYRHGEIEPRSPEIIEAWISQFESGSQDAILQALIVVFSTAYFSRTRFIDFLKGLALSEKVAGSSTPASFWKNANVLNIQQGGASQSDILVLFDEVLQETHGFGLADTGSDSGVYVYLDDVIATGSRLRHDICDWVKTVSHPEPNLHVIAPILYEGSYWIDSRMNDAATESGKNLTVKKWRVLQLENRRAFRNNSDVLWPATLPSADLVQAYASALKDKGHPVELRSLGAFGKNNVFESDTQKQFLETIFVTRGCEIRDEQTSLPEKLRPLGFQNLDSLGFGSMVVTYRNCPNNTPLALWVEQDDYPALLPRKTNSESAAEIFLKSIG